MNLEGELGYKGERGYSAYEIAVQHGYEGTEEEWVQSYINADNYYNKNEVDTKCANYVLKGDFARITFQPTTSSPTGLKIDYPTGFTPANSIILSVSRNEMNNGNINTRMILPVTPSGGSSSTTIYENVGKIWIIDSEPEDVSIYTYTVILMKTGE